MWVIPEREKAIAYCQRHRVGDVSVTCLSYNDRASPRNDVNEHLRLNVTKSQAEQECIHMLCA